MRIKYGLLLLGSAFIVGSQVSPVQGQGVARRLVAVLIGFNEVSAVSTPAAGLFRGRIAQDEMSIQYSLQFANLQGAVTQAHIHLGQPHTNGGISVWLCDSVTNPSPRDTTPACPTTSPARVNGTLTPADVIGPAGQGISSEEFAELLRAIRAGATYANVHSTSFVGGEIRGQVIARQ
jgi:hypothetical protein